MHRCAFVHHLPMWQTIQNKIRRSFSDAAVNYEVLSSLHKEIGRELIKKVIDRSCVRILDVGTGTGYLANKAKFYFPEAQVIGMDIADGMVLQADKLKEGIQIVQADANALPFQKETFDLIVSNLAYQWMPDLAVSFKQAHHCLKPAGDFCATLFGHRTMEEFYDILQTCIQPGSALRRLPDGDAVDQALKVAGFNNTETDYEIIRVQFADIMDLLKWVKGIGANSLNQDIVFGKQTIAKMDEMYKVKYPYHNGICVTFEIIWLRAQK